MLGAYGRLFRLEIVSSTIGYVRSKAEVRERLERVYELLPAAPRASRAPGRPDVRRRAADGGDRTRADGGAARSSRSTSSRWGSPRSIVQQLADFLLRLNEEEGVAILLVEQNAAARLRALRARVRARDGPGRARGRRARELRDESEVRSAYLGRAGRSRASVTTFLQLVVVGISTGSVFAVVGMSLVLVFRRPGSSTSRRACSRSSAGC